MLCAIRAVQLERRKLGRQARRVWRYGNRYDCGARAQHSRFDLTSPGANATGSRARVWFVGRKYLSGRVDPGATLLSAAGAGMGAVSYADRQSLHVRIRDASGWWHHGGAGTECGHADAEGSEVAADLRG